MSKILNKTKKISTSMLFFIALIAVIVTSINASINNYTTNVLDLAKEAQKDSWFDYSPSDDLIGKKIDVTAKTWEENALNYNSAYCIDPHTPKAYSSDYYDIVNVFDINKSNNTVKIYSLENPKGTEYALSDERIKPVIMLSYLTQQATLNPTDTSIWGYKDVIERIFNNEKWITDLREIGLSNSFEIGSTLEEIIDLGRTTGNLTVKDVQDKIDAAQKYAEDLMEQGASETAELNDSAMSQLEKDNVSMARINGKTFIGPYRISLKSTTVGEIKVNGENAVGISTDGKTVENFNKIKNGEKFWIVTEKDYDEIASISVKAKETISYIQSRMVLLGNSPSQNFLIWRNKEIPKQPEVNLETPKLGTLEIQKVDEFEGKGEVENKTISLKDVEFKIYAKGKGWLVKEGEKISFNNDDKAFDKVESFKTDENGKIKIENVPTGEYTVYETGLPDRLKEIYDLNSIDGIPTIPSNETRKAKKIATFGVNAGQTATVKAENNRAFTDVVIEKTDKDTNAKLNGVEFVLYRVKDENNKTVEGFVEADDNNVATGKYTDYEHAKRLITVNGVTPKLTRLPVGTYELYEVGAGEKSNLYSIGTFAKNGQKYKGNLVDTKQIKATESGEFKFTVENVQEYIKISGYVFEKQLTGKNKTGYENLTEFTNDDKKIEGIQVKLIDYYTGQEQVTTTDANGAYSFDKVRIRYSGDSEKVDYLSNYLVVYEYDGFRYQGVLTDINKRDKYQTEKNNTKVIHPTSAKAVEKSDDTLQSEYTREKLNDLFKEITGEGQELSNGVKLQYEKQENGEYTLKNISKRTVVPEQDKVPEHIKIDRIGDFEVQSTTAGTLLQEYYDFLKNNSKNKAVEEITGLNFGVYQREKPEIQVQEDIYGTEVQVRNKSYRYLHNGIPERYYKEGETVNTSLGAQFDDYFFPIHEADLYWDNPEDKSKEFKADVIYKIGLTNSSTNLYYGAKQITNWCSPNYEISGVYISDEFFANDDEYAKTMLNCKARYVKDDSGLNKYVITFNEPINLNPVQNGEGKSNAKYIYIKYHLKDIRDIYEKQETLESHTEISNYTIYSDKDFTKLYAGIDRKSVPNNYKAQKGVKAFKNETYEQDTSSAPGLHLVDAGDRTLSGTVFEDNAVVSGAGKERIGDGEYQEGQENTIAGVKVELVDVDNGNKVQQIYIDSNGDGAKEWVDLGEIKTSENGSYEIKGLPVGNYQVVFKWGDDKYKVEDYKSTIFKNKERLNNPNWYKEETPRYSDAIDDYGVRKIIDANAFNKAKGEQYIDAVSIMTSYSPVCSIDVEKETIKDSTTQSEENLNKFKYDVKNLDFGIIERPRQAMEINKNLSAVKLNTNDGQPIANARIKDGKLEVITGEKYVSGGPDLGYIWVQVDKSITQGMKAEMGYTITVTNTSELDYDDENYYKFGEIPSGNAKTMTMNADQVFDYSKGAELTANEVNSSWEVLTPAKYVQTVGEGKTMVEENFEEQLSKAVDSEGNITENYEWNSAYEVTKTIFTDWLEQLAQTKKTDVRTVKLANRDIIHYVGTELTKALKPGESASAEINTSKIVANSDEIRFDNDAEITHFSYETDRKTGTIPNARTSKLIDRGGWVSITPATGEDRDYTWIVVTAVSAIALLGAGIIFIKKKVLK